MTTHEVLVAARNEFARRGHWQQGNLETPTRGLCPILAFKKVGCLDDQAVRVREAFAAAAGIDKWGIPLWNDAPGRTKEEVLVAFDKAIAATAPPPPDPDWSELVEDRASFREPEAIR